MARKKEYSLEDASAKKHKPPNFNKPIESNYKQENQNWQSKTAKHKDQNTNASCSRGAGKVYDVGPLRAQLNCYGLTIRDIPGDGNCLFRALGDQLEGHSMNHLKHRIETVHYMIAHRHHFEPFIDVPFERYVENLSRPGTYAGQDALVAFARLHKVNIVIHQLNSPLWHIEGADNSDNNDSIELHLSYHNGEHYSSVRRSGDIDNTPPHIRIVSQITGSTEVPCCTSTQTICTSTSPIQSHVKFSNTTTHKHPKQVNYLSSSTINSSQPSIHHHNNDTINRINDVRSSFMHNEDDEFSILLEEVMLRSGCKDAVLATEAFIDNNGDVDQTVDYLLSLAIIIEPMDKKSATITSHSDSVIDRQQKQRCHRISADPCGDLDVNVHNEDRMGVPLRFVNRRQSSRSRTAIQQNSRTVRSSVGRQEKLTPRNANTNSNKSSRSKSRLNTTANRTTSNNRMREETTAASDWETSLEGDIRFLTL